MYFACFGSFGDSNPRKSTLNLSPILKLNIVLAESILLKYKVGSFLLAIVLIFWLERLPFLFAKNLKGMIDMYFTDTPERRKFEREMRQKPNFDRRNDDCDESGNKNPSDNKISSISSKTKDWGWFCDNKNQESY